MGVIIDTLIIGLGEPNILTRAFPACEITRLTTEDSTLQRYRVALKNADEQRYFDFLQDNCLALTSNRFYFRMKNDHAFAERMKARLACGRDGGRMR